MAQYTITLPSVNGDIRFRLETNPIQQPDGSYKFQYKMTVVPEDCQKLVDLPSREDFINTPINDPTSPPGITVTVH